MLISTKQASKILNQTLNTTRRRLNPADNIEQIGDLIKNFYDQDRVIVMAAQDKEKGTGAYRSKHPKKYKRKTIPYSGLVSNKKDDPYGVMIKPQYRGSMCRTCGEVEVPTGAWDCDDCKLKKTKTDYGVINDNYVYG
jgi:hypothetical protein